MIQELSSLILGMKVSKQTQTLFTVWIGGLNRGTSNREAILVRGKCQSKTCIRICMNKDTNKILSYLNLFLTTYSLQLDKSTLYYHICVCLVLYLVIKVRDFNFSRTTKIYLSFSLSLHKHFYVCSSAFLT